MGRNHQDHEKDVTNPVDEEEEKKIRINRNLARFLAEQAAQHRNTQQRQSNCNNGKSSVNILQIHPSLSTSNKNTHQRIQYGLNVSNDLQLQTRSGQLNTNHKLDKMSYTKRSSNSSNKPCHAKEGPCSSSSEVQPALRGNNHHPQNEEERQNILNNNISCPGRNSRHMSNIGHKTNTYTNKRCTMRVSKLIGQSLTFSCRLNL